MAAELLANLVARSKADVGAGYGTDNLELFRQSCPEYLRLLLEEISDAVHRNFEAPLIPFQQQLPAPGAPVVPVADALPPTVVRLDARRADSMKLRRFTTPGRSVYWNGKSTSSRR